MSEIRGIVIQSRMDYLEKKTNEAIYKEVMNRLSDKARQAIGEQIFLTNLYSFEILKELDRVIVEAIGKPAEEIFRDIGKYFAAIIVDSYFYNYVEAKNPQKFLAQISNLFPHLWQFGKYYYKKSSNNSAVVKFEYDEDIHKPYCWFTQEFLKNGLVMCSAKNVRLNEKECEAENGNACVYELSWEQ